MKTEIERARESIKEYRKGYGQSQLPTDCIVQLMMGHAKRERLILPDVVKPFTAEQVLTVLNSSYELIDAKSFFEDYK